MVQRNNVLDYDDLLLYWRRMMEEPGLAAEIGARFDHVLVDEYQDTWYSCGVRGPHPPPMASTSEPVGKRRSYKSAAASTGH
jgi:hypothetical protein